MAMAQSKNLQVTNRDMEQMASMMGRVAQLGNLNLLGRLGINIEGIDKDLFRISSEAERMGMIMQAAERDFGGFAAAVAKTPVGAINKATNAFDDLRQQIGDSAMAFKGAFASEALARMPQISSAIERVADFLRNNFVEAVSAAGLAVGALGVKFGILAAAKLVAFAKPIAIVGAFAGVMKSLGFSFQDIFAAAVGTFMGIWEAVKFVGGAIKDAFKTAVGAAKDAFGGLFCSTEEGFLSSAEKIKDILANVLDFIIALIDKKAMPFRELANFIGNVFQSPVGAGVRLFENMGNTVLNILIGSRMDFKAGRNAATR